MAILRFDSELDYISHIEILISDDITEIRKESDSDFYFRIRDIWHRLTFNYVYLTIFTQGRTLMLQSGPDISMLEVKRPYTLASQVVKLESADYSISFLQFKKDEKVKLIFEKLKLLHAKFSNQDQKSIQAVFGAISEFIVWVDKIDRIEHKTFLLSKDEKLFFFHQTLHLQHGKFVPILEIINANPNRRNQVQRVTEEKEINEIMTLLEISYNLSLIDRNSFVDVKANVQNLLEI